jgi:hypothetical protein
VNTFIAHTSSAQSPKAGVTDSLRAACRQEDALVKQGRR